MPLMLYYAVIKRCLVKIKTAGFTTIELLIAIAIIGIAVPGIISFTTALNRLNDRAVDLNTINALAENKIESLRSIGYIGLENGTTDFSNELPASINAPKSASYTVSTPSPGIKQVDLTVTYTLQNRLQSIEFKTYVGEVGVGQY